MLQVVTSNNTASRQQQEGNRSSRVHDHLLATKAAAAQLKLRLLQLSSAFNTDRPRRAISSLTAACDVAISALEKLDCGRSPRGAQ